MHFKAESVGNLLRLLITIQIENTNDRREIAAYHQRFDHEQDELFEDFLKQLYPNGCTIGEQQINELVLFIHKFMQTDEESIDAYIAYDKRHCNSWVYFKPEKIFRKVALGDHELTIIEICTNFFHGCDDIDTDYLKNFILQNFQIRSDYSTLEHIADDAKSIKRQILDRLLWTS